MITYFNLILTCGIVSNDRSLEVIIPLYISYLPRHYITVTQFQYILKNHFYCMGICDKLSRHL